MSKKFPRLFLILLAALFFLNLIQSYFTELIYDEAYYWYYAKELSWGYFDHPPMVAFLIKLSSLFFSGELGVRFMSCVLSAGTYVILWSLITHPKKNNYILHFFLLVFSMTLMNAYGFLTLPDTPLLFFTALFLWLYKQFLQKPSILITISLGAVMAALMYSKYHAFLVIFFVFLSNVKLIQNGRAWLAVAIALAMYAPHFYWLFENDFVSIKYHLYERPNQPYSFTKFTLGYFVNLVAIFGLLFYWMYLALIKTRSQDDFTKALKYLSYGVILFFFVSSFNRRVQTQWIIIISIPMLVLAFNYLIENARSRKWIFRMSLISLVLMLYARAWLVYKPLLPILFETHGNKAWVKEVKEKSGGVPLVCENSYRRAPMYEFYSGIKSFSLNNHMYRKNQYSVDDSEERVRKERVLYSTIYRSSGDFSYSHLDGTVFYGVFMDDFESFRKLECIVEEESCPNCYSLKVFNPYDFDVPFGKLSFSVAFSNAHKQVKELIPIEVNRVDPSLENISSKDTLFLQFKLPEPKVQNSVYFRVGISENGLLPGLNGKPVKFNP
nr:glycosyltransferase family 39 protein [Allomuricauda sp.]